LLRGLGVKKPKWKSRTKRNSQKFPKRSEDRETRTLVRGILLQITSKQSKGSDPAEQQKNGMLPEGGGVWGLVR